MPNWDHTGLTAGAMLSHPDFISDPWNYVRPGGESQAMVHARIGRFLADLRRDCVKVTHALPAVMIRAHCLDLTPEETMGYEHPHAGLTRLSHGTEAYFGG